MQRSWRSDADKLTFIACLATASLFEDSEVKAGELDSPSQMIGDVNLFLTADDSPRTCTGELELMIAPLAHRRRGYGRATVLAFLHYVAIYLSSILAEFAAKEGVENMVLSQLKVKIGESNKKSIGLFESIGFVKIRETSNYFGEFELVLEGDLDEERTKALLEKWGVQSWKELRYIEEN